MATSKRKPGRYLRLRSECRGAALQAVRALHFQLRVHGHLLGDIALIVRARITSRTFLFRLTSPAGGSAAVHREAIAGSPRACAHELFVEPVGSLLAVRRRSACQAMMRLRVVVSMRQ